MKYTSYIVLAFFLMGLIPLMSAAWPIPKDATCQFMNLSGAACDETWCGIHDCAYNASLQVCSCDFGGTPSEINVTEISDLVNSSIDGLNKSLAVNKSEIEAKVIEKVKEWYKNETQQLRVDIDDKIDARVSSSRTTSNDGGLKIEYVLIALIAVGGFVFVMQNKKKDKVRNERARVQSYEQDPDLEAKMKELEITKLKNKLAKLDKDKEE